MKLQRARTISRSGRKSPLSRPPSPRFADIPIEELPPLPIRSGDPRNSKPPLLRTTSPRSTNAFQPTILSHKLSQSPPSRLSSPVITEVQQPSIPLLFPAPRYDSSLHLRQQDPRDQPPDLTGQIIRDDKYLSAFGGYGDVLVGNWQNGSKIHKVAIKVLRPPTEADRHKTNKRSRREIEVWKRLVHDNIVPLLGIITDVAPYTSMGMVSPWMENGDLNKFLRESATALTVSGRFALLRDIAAGLAYLHSQFVIHGDLTGANILIDSDGKARLIDFGLSTIKAEFEGTSFYSPTAGGALRWRALELFLEDDVAPTLTAACDIYSYGSVTLQVISGRVPYHYLSETRVFYAVSKGIRPHRPSEPWVSDAYWTFIQQCWDQTPAARPSIQEVNDRIGAFHRGCVNRDRYLAIPSTDGYETDSEAFHAAKQRARYSGWQSDNEGFVKHKKSGKKLRVPRPKTFSLPKTIHSQRKTAIPTVRSINLQHSSSQLWKEAVNREVSTLKTAIHPNICNIIDVEHSDARTIRLSLEPIIGMSLNDILRRNSPTENQISCLLSMILDGLRHLHDLGIVHGNLNSGNIVLDTQCCVKLVDFGISAKIVREQLEHSEIADIPYWTAPEVITDYQRSPAMDIWALGIISIEIVEGHPPYFDMNPRAARQLIAARGTPTLKDPNAFPWELIKFLSSCLVGNILKRATVSELCLHKFLAKPSSTMVLIPLLNIEMQRVF